MKLNINIMTSKVAYISLVLSLLCACSHTNYQEKLNTLEGRHVKVAVNHLGLPDNKYALGADQVYIWGNDSITVNHSPITTYGGYGSRSGGYGGVGLVFGSGAHDTYRQSCQIKALTDQKDIIKRMEYESRGGGCSHYSEGINSIPAQR